MHEMNAVHMYVVSIVQMLWSEQAKASYLKNMEHAVSVWSGFLLTMFTKHHVIDRKL